MTDTAIILAGGRGERLMPHTQDKPKVMVDLLDRPMIVWQLAWLKSHGITKVIIAAGYKAEVLQKFLGDGSAYGLTLTYSIENQPLGTGGALKQALEQTKAQTVVVTNGDIITDGDLGAMIKTHQAAQALVTIMAVTPQLPWDVLELDKTQRVSGYRTKPVLSQRVSGGIFVMDRSVQARLPDQGDQETSLLKALPKERFQAFLPDGYWKAVDTTKDKSQVEAYLQNGDFRSRYNVL